MTAPTNLTCPTLIKLTVNYNASTGVLHWKPRAAWMFAHGEKGFQTREARAKRWNKLYAGKETGCKKKDCKYKVVMLFNTPRYAHRLAVVCMTGQWPCGEVDHINGDRADNRWDNLREVSTRENMRNQAIPKSNKSGHMGVMETEAGSFRAYIWALGRSVGLGTYATIEDAIAARKAGERRYGFHKNHGRVQI